MVCVPGGGEVPELDRPALGDGLRQLVDRLLVLPVAHVGAEADGEAAVELLQVVVRRGGQGGGGLAQGGVEGGLELGALQGTQEPPAEGEGHQFRRGEGKGGDVAEPLHQLPDHPAAVHLLREEREPRGFQRLQIPADRPVVPRELGRQPVGQPLERHALPGRLEGAEQVPLPGDLVIPGHDDPPFPWG